MAGMSDGFRVFRRIVASGAVLLLAVVYLFPVLYMVMGSFLPDDEVLTRGFSWTGWFTGDLSWNNYRDVFARTDLLRFMGNSLLINGTIVALGLLINSLAGYALARMSWRGRDKVLGLVLLLMIIPFEAIAVPLFYQMTVIGLRDTYLVQILPFIGNAFAIFWFYTFFLDLPAEWEEAARIDGAGPWRTFFTIILPNSKPCLVTVAILTFLTHWSAYLWPLLVTVGERVRPLPLAIAQFYTLPPLQWGDILAFGVMMVLPVLAVFLVFQRWFIRGIASSGIKG